MKERELGIRQDKKRVKEIYGNKCANFEQCGNTEKPHIHHILFQSDHYPKPITESKANYVHLCWPCELKTHEIAT